MTKDRGLMRYRTLVVLVALVGGLIVGSLPASGDAQSIVFADRRSVFTIDSTGSGLTRVAQASDELFATAWSTAHDQIAYGVRNHVVVSDGAGLFSHPLVTLRPGVIVGGLSWSPTDQRIAIEGTRKIPHSGRSPRFCTSIWTMGADGSSLVQIRRGEEPGNGVTWSPNGRWIAAGFETYNGTTPCSKRSHDGLYRMHPNGSGFESLQAPFGRSPDWSPTGRRIAFDDWRHACHACGQLWVMSANGHHQHKLLGHGFGAQFYEPRWSPSGTQLAYVHHVLRSGRVELWVMDSSGNQRHRIFSDSGYRTSIWPDW